MRFEVFCIIVLLVLVERFLRIVLEKVGEFLVSLFNWDFVFIKEIELRFG